MRRLIIEEPYASGAIWTRRFALAGSVLALAAVLLAHRPLVQPQVGLAVMSLALGLAAVSLLCAAKAARSIWRTGRKGLGRIIVGLAAAAATLGYPGYLAVSALGLPVVSEATSDAGDPPRFSRSAKAYALRGDLDGISGPPAEHVDPLMLDLDGTDAFAVVEKAVGRLRWRLIDAVPPGGRRGLGHIDAFTASPVMRLPQDIAIRIRPLAGQTRVDIRSAARLGLYDFGESVKTIRQFADAVQDQIDEQ